MIAQGNALGNVSIKNPARDPDRVARNPFAGRISNAFSVLILSSLDLFDRPNNDLSEG